MRVKVGLIDSNHKVSVRCAAADGIFDSKDDVLVELTISAAGDFVDLNISHSQ